MNENHNDIWEKLKTHRSIKEIDTNRLRLSAFALHITDLLIVISIIFQKVSRMIAYISPIKGSSKAFGCVFAIPVFLIMLTGLLSVTISPILIVIAFYMFWSYAFMYTKELALVWLTILNVILFIGGNFALFKTYKSKKNDFNKPTRIAVLGSYWLCGLNPYLLQWFYQFETEAQANFTDCLPVLIILSIWLSIRFQIYSILDREQKSIIYFRSFQSICKNFSNSHEISWKNIALLTDDGLIEDDSSGDLSFFSPKENCLTAITRDGKKYRLSYKYKREDENLTDLGQHLSQLLNIPYLHCPLGGVIHPIPEKICYWFKFIDECLYRIDRDGEEWIKTRWAFLYPKTIFTKEKRTSINNFINSPIPRDQNQTEYLSKLTHFTTGRLSIVLSGLFLLLLSYFSFIFFMYQSFSVYLLGILCVGLVALGMFFYAHRSLLRKTASILRHGKYKSISTSLSFEIETINEHIYFELKSDKERSFTFVHHPDFPLQGIAFTKGYPIWIRGQRKQQSWRKRLKANAILDFLYSLISLSGDSDQLQHVKQKGHTLNYIIYFFFYFILLFLL